MWLKEKLTEIPGEIPHEVPKDPKHPSLKVGVGHEQGNISGSITSPPIQTEGGICENCNCSLF